MQREKRIAIVTWLGNGNYGTSLQSFALVYKVQQLGYPTFFLKKVGVLSSIHQLFSIIKPRKPKEELTWKQHNFQQFLELYPKRNYYTILSPLQIRNVVDVYITGSDQIWNTYHSWDPFYYLYFAGKTKRIAYASSLGTDTINPKYRNRMCRYLQKFSHISLREQSSVALLNQELGRNDVCCMPDPTFLLSSVDWKQICDSACENCIPEEPYIVVYLIGTNPTYHAMVKDIRIQTGISRVIVIPAAESSPMQIEGALVVSDAGPKEFVSLIMNASIVCTDSFHAAALSINFSIPFSVAKRFRDGEVRSQNSRLNDLLAHYGLSHRLYEGQEINWLSEDWEGVQRLVKKDRDEAEKYLINSIER